MAVLSSIDQERVRGKEVVNMEETPRHPMKLWSDEVEKYALEVMELLNQVNSVERTENISADIDFLAKETNNLLDAVLFAKTQVD